MKTLKKVLSIILIFSIFTYLFFNISKNWSVISTFAWRFNLQDTLILIFLSIPVFLLNVFAWHLVTCSLGLNLSFRKNLQIWTFSNLGRFIPGGIWQYIGRGYLLKSAGISKTEGSVAIFMETMLILFVSSAIAATTLFTLELPFNLNVKYVFWGLGFLFAIILSGIFYNVFKKTPPLGGDELKPLKMARQRRAFQRTTALAVGIYKSINHRIFLILGKILREDISRINLKVNWNYLPITTVSFAFQSILAGSILFFLARGAVDLPLNLLPVVISGYTLSWLLGYLSVFSPSGLGIQEISIAAFLGSFMPFPVASLVAILFRLLCLVLEFSFLLFVVLVMKLKPH